MAERLHTTIRDTGAAPVAATGPVAATASVPGPKRILSIDSGGLHGLVSLAMLGRIEAVLRAQSSQARTRPTGRPFRLCDYFDLIGGSGTGAFIAAGLAWGHSVEDMIDVLTTVTRASLRRRLFRTASPGAIDRGALLSALQDLFGYAPLTTAKLRTGVAIVTRRVDGARGTMILSNRTAPVGVPRTDEASVTLADAVRASLPTLPRDQAEIVPCGGGLHGAFGAVDHGPHADPALALLLMATNASGAGRADHEPGLGWRAHADALFMASVGAVRSPRVSPAAGTDRVRMKPDADGVGSSAVMGEAVMRAMALSTKRALSVDDVTGGFAPESLRGAPRLTYARFAMALDRAWLQDRVERRLSHRDIDRLRSMAREQQIEPLLTLARDIADAEVRPDHFPARFRCA
ncbi:MAG: patatin-like phospholipase family protein [Alphaproteobacteria bacterium]